MLRLHLGCGKRNFGSEWVHIDGGDFPHVVSHDIVNLPYEENSVDIIYASHVIEYFDRVEVIDVLKKWYYALKPEGILRVAVPDFGQMTLLYNSGMELNNFLGPLYGRMEMNGKYIYHKTCYDFKDLSKILYDTGFKSVNFYDWRKTDHAQFDDHSQAYIPHMDKEEGCLISLNVEATK